MDKKLWINEFILGGAITKDALFFKMKLFSTASSMNALISKFLIPFGLPTLCSICRMVLNTLSTRN